MQAKEKKQFARDLMAVLNDLVERAELEHFNKVELDDDKNFSRRTFGVDVPEIGWMTVSYTERKHPTPRVDG